VTTHDVRERALQDALNDYLRPKYDHVDDDALRDAIRDAQRYGDVVIRIEPRRARQGGTP
jgi:hypothetical protein